MNAITIITRTVLATAAVGLLSIQPSYLRAEGSRGGGGGASGASATQQEEMNAPAETAPEESMNGGGGATETGTGEDTGMGGGGGVTGAGTVEGSQIVGTVRAVNPETNELTVQADDGTTRTYVITTDVPLMQGEQSIPLAGLAQGDKVMVTVESDGTTPRSVELQ